MIIRGAAWRNEAMRTCLDGTRDVLPDVLMHSGHEYGSAQPLVDGGHESGQLGGIA